MQSSLHVVFVICRQFVVQRTADIEPSCACVVWYGNLTTMTVQFLIFVALTAVILLFWIYCQIKTIQLIFVVWSTISTRHIAVMLNKFIRSCQHFQSVETVRQLTGTLFKRMLVQTTTIILLLLQVLSIANLKVIQQTWSLDSNLENLLVLFTTVWGYVFL